MHLLGTFREHPLVKIVNYGERRKLLIICTVEWNGKVQLDYDFIMVILPGAVIYEFKVI